MSALPERHRFTADQYERMGAAGLFAEGDRVELIAGEIVEMNPIGSRHAGCVIRLNRLLTAIVGEGAVVSVQNPVRLGTHSEPQPDVALLLPRPDCYSDSHPKPSEILLVVEVADTTLTWDRDVKAPLYGAAGIPELWVVDVTEGCVYVFTGPEREGYAVMRQVTAGDTITTTVLDGLTIPVADILGPP